MEFAVTFSELFSVIGKLEATINKVFERKDIIQDNIETLRRLKDLYRDAGNTLGTLEAVPMTDIITRTRLSQFDSALKQNARTLSSLAEEVKTANVLKRVKRMRQVLAQCESEVKEFFEFLTNHVSPGLIEEDRLEQGMYLPDNNVPKNPPRLCLDYRSNSTCEGQLKAAVLDESEKSVVAVVASGQGGVGKSCALRGLADDLDIRNRFPGGTLYIQLGNESSIYTVIEGITRIVRRTGGLRLANKIAQQRKLQDASDEAAVWFRHHICLVLIDDIWWVNDINSEVFTILRTMLNDESRLVYTSRDKRFLGRTDRVIEFREKEARGELARRMLMTHAGFCANEKLDRDNKVAFEAILDLCQGLPLAFGIAGASVLRNSRKQHASNRQNAWKDFHREIMTNQKCLLDVSAEEYGTLSKIVEMSLKVLEVQNEGSPGRYQEFFRALCVLEKKQTVPLQVLQKVWNLETLSQAEDIVEMFYDVSIVQIWKEGNCVSVQLHDLVLDIAIRKASDKFETQEFFRSLVHNYIPGHQETKTATSKGIQSNAEDKKTFRKKRAALRKWTKWRRCERNGTAVQSIWFQTWWNTESDGYLHDNLCRLLRKAGKLDDLIWLLSKPQWIVMRLKNGGIHGVEQDIEEGRAGLRDTLSSRPELMKYYDMVGSAARLSWNFVNQNLYEAWFQLYARLVAFAKGCEITQRFVEEIERCAPRPWVKASAGFLQPAGGPGVEVINSPGQVLCVCQGEGFLYSVWRSPGAIGVMQYYLRKGTLRKLKFMPTDEQEKEDSLFRRLVLRTRCAVISKDLNTVATGHEDGSVAVWSRETGRLLRVTKGHTDRVNSVVFTAHDTRIVSASSDATVRVWDAVSGLSKGNLRGHKGPVTCVAASSDGTRILSSSAKEGVIRMWDESLWDVLSGQAVGYVVGRSRYVASLAVAADGSKLVSGSLQDVIQIWDTISVTTAGHELSGGTKGSQNSVECLTMSVDGTRIVSGSADGAVRIWDIESGKAIGSPLMGHTRSITCLSISEDGSRIVSGSEDETIRVWDAGSNKSAATRTKCVSRVSRVGVDKRSSIVVAYSEGFRTTGWLWDVNRGECVMTSTDDAWRSMVDGLALSWSTCDHRARHLTDGRKNFVLGTCEGDVRCFGDFSFSDCFSAFCKIER